MPTNICVLPQDPEKEADDAPKLFTNIDTEDFSQNWGGHDYVVKAGETTTLPKYLVNVMATNLARKIYKRACYAAFKGTEYEKGNAAIRFVNPQEEYKLMKQIVAKNFPDEVPAEPVMPTAETVIDKTKVEQPPAEVPANKFKCDKCDFSAKTKAGLATHRRSKHAEK